ncbi:hypothetical protein EWM64_g2247 [Hericium alpestre]|uniref:DNA primase large subunit C-terminal domain-containing protein n=1 Tax=Hericium alpestre TaxID=135208 RepID=A0A4Z0A415_9AGAM|nr:hypothetical protein EWM64_g2247 [Hericium alpestre]
MSSYKLWNLDVREREYDSDRTKHKSSSKHQPSAESRSKSRPDAKQPSRGYVSEGQVPTHAAQPSHHYDTLPSKPKSSRHVPTSSQQYPSTHATKATTSNTNLPVATGSHQPRYPEQSYDSRTYPVRGTTANKVVSSSADRPRAPDERKSSRHHRTASAQPATSASTAVPSSSAIQAQTFWTPPSQEPPKTSKRQKENDTEQARDADRAKEKERRREERRHEEDRANAQESRREEERRREKEQRRKEKEERRLHEAERLQEQKARDDTQRLELARERSREQRARDDLRGLLHLPHMGKESKRSRYKDSDESDNSGRKLAGTTRHRHHREPDGKAEVRSIDVDFINIPPLNRFADQVAGMSIQHQQTFSVPVTQSAAQAQALAHRSENVPSSSSREHRRHTTPLQTSRVLPGYSSDQPKPSKHSRSRSEAVPYPPGYATSTSDTEKPSKREHHLHPYDALRPVAHNGDARQGTSTSANGLSRTRTSSNAQHQTLAPPAAKQESKSGLTQWLFSRSGDTPNPRPPESQYATPAGTPTPPSPAPLPVPPPRIERENSPAQVVSIRAAQGPSDQLPDQYHKRSAPAPVPTANGTSYDSAYNPSPSSRTQAAPDPRYAVPVQPQARLTVAHQSSTDSRTPAAAGTQNHPGPYSAHAPYQSYPGVSQPTVPSPAAHLTRTPPYDPRANNVPHTPSPYIPASSAPPPGQSYGNYGHPTATSHTTVPASVSYPTSGHSHREHATPPELTGYGHAPSAGSAVPHAIAMTPSNGSARRPHPDLAASFPINEDAPRTTPQYHSSTLDQTQHQPSRQTSRDAAKDRNSRQDPNAYLNPGSYATAAYDPRSPKSTKTPSPGHHARYMSQNTPPKETSVPTQYFPASSPQLPSSSTDYAHAHDPSRYNAPRPSSRNATPSAYLATSGYPSHLDAAPTAPTNYVANLNVPSNGQSRSDNPSPRSHNAPPVTAPPAAARVTSRTPSYDTGSTTLLGQTPSSQAPTLASPTAQGQNMLYPSATYVSQQGYPANQASARAAPGTSSYTASASRQARHQHSASVPSPALPSQGAAMSPQMPTRSQTQPVAPRVPVAPQPVRAYTQPQGGPDTYANSQMRRVEVAGHSSTPVPSRSQQRKVMPSPSPEPDLRTPSSLARSNSKLPFSPEPDPPPAYSQSLTEPKKKPGFFGGFFRSKSVSGKQRPGDPAPQAAPAETAAQPSSTKAPPTKVAFASAPAPHAADAMRKGAATPASQKTITGAAPAVVSEKKSSAANPFSAFRLLSKRNRTISAASVEAADGTHGGASTVITSPAGSTRSPTPKLYPPSRDPVQATYDWRNREEAELHARGAHRRRRPGVTFEGQYIEDHPYAQRNKPSYAGMIWTALFEYIFPGSLLSRNECPVNYDRPPLDDITIEEFETYALDRLRILAEIESCYARNRPWDEICTITRKQCEKYLPMEASTSRGDLDSQRKPDHIGHFVLRLAFCRSEELRRRFIKAETTLFRVRYEYEGQVAPADRKAFLNSRDFDWIQVDAREKAQYASQLQNSGVRNDEDFYKVKWTRVPDLVERRRVFLKGGYAYVPTRDQSSIVYQEFQSNLEKALEATLPRLDEDTRLVPILNHLSQGFLAGVSSEWNETTAGDEIKAEMVEELSRKHFPACMRNLQDNLKRNHHLKHFGRLQYGLFLKILGLSIEEAMMFWRKSFSGFTDDQFNKNYKYNIRHSYGLEGKRANYQAKSCQQILTSDQPGPTDSHGCPFRHFSPDNLQTALLSMYSSQGLTSADIPEILNTVKGGHYHVACTRVFEITHAHRGVKKGDGIGDKESVTHPNQYAARSRELERAAEAEVKLEADGDVVMA